MTSNLLFGRSILFFNYYSNWVTAVFLTFLICGCLPKEKKKTNSESKRVTLLSPESQQKFINPLPIPQRIHTKRGSHYQIPIKEAFFWLGLKSKSGDSLKTKMWGFEYEGKVYSPGPTFLAQTDEPITVQWNNQLPPHPHILPVDYSIHTPHLKDSNSLPIVIHLHGGHTESESDGYPEAWYTQNYQELGPDYVKKNYYYDNSQEATTLWYHDHTIGMTRLNVYAGLYGFYLISDPNEKRLQEENVLPPDSLTLEIVFNDANFTEKGELYYPGRHGQPIDPIIKKKIEENWPDPTHFDEFFGEFIMANNMCWPKLEVKPCIYRFRILNGSSSRTFVLEFENQMQFYQIGSDGGFLEKPVSLTLLVLAPAERADLLVDFSKFKGKNIILKNLGPELPFRGYVNPKDPKNSTKLIYNKGGNQKITDGFGGFASIADPNSTGLVMRFDVENNKNTQRINFNSSISLRSSFPTLEPHKAIKTRKLILFNLKDDLGRTLTLLGTLDKGSLFFMDSVTEIIEKNTIEIWEIYNTTNSAHPIHLHQVQFQVLNRQLYEGDLVFHDQKLMDTDRTFKGAHLKFKTFKGEPILPQAIEKGLKDTALSLAGQVTRLIAYFDRSGKYVWHCHIITHEDYDMMRPFIVVEKTH
ncbi:multicopper oxidase family protein [Xanthovirga aplysinae]|uniref:multicopper oxidase family protein n=1 Tax=Xanthovirga aplysinae TaxID=2529853 RepID=UPI0012BCD06F|nr:multicopper oxidase domain-containing protein [Xanthovirga aplysinae]MTI30582.1 hypothetical protein [Xanthovirga aplysinae]